MELDKKELETNGSNRLCFSKGKGGIPIIDIKNQYGSATISLQGAHVLSWIPEGEEEVIWLSEEAKFAPGKSVRGGIPVCWPWFGAHESSKDFPAHGFARTTTWELICMETLEDGRTRVTFTTEPQADNEHMWPPQTTVLYQLTVGRKLQMELITHNNGAQPITIGQALHTYFRIGDVSKVLLHGLDDSEYLDKLENFERKNQRGPIFIDREIDRIYLDTVSECVIEDRQLKRNIVINKCGSHSTVVWNPWQDTAEKMGDLGEDGYRKMLCVESCNAADDVVTIEPGKSHHLWVQYQVQKL
jgi:glucose-6-phosphate 1-epimerase